MIWFNSLVSFLQANALWYIAPFYFIAGFYIFLVLGWFFSTDYYDKIYDAWDTGDDDFYILHIMCIMIFLFIIAALAIGGPSGNGSLIISTIMWLIFVLPIIASYLLKVRKYLRQKRGKPL